MTFQFGSNFDTVANFGSQLSFDFLLGFALSQARNLFTWTLLAETLLAETLFPRTLFPGTLFARIPSTRIPSTRTLFNLTLVI